MRTGDLTSIDPLVHATTTVCVVISLLLPPLHKLYRLRQNLKLNSQPQAIPAQPSGVPSVNVPVICSGTGLFTAHSGNESPSCCRYVPVRLSHHTTSGEIRHEQGGLLDELDELLDELDDELLDDELLDELLDELDDELLDELLDELDDELLDELLDELEELDIDELLDELEELDRDELLDELEELDIDELLDELDERDDEDDERDDDDEDERDDELEELDDDEQQQEGEDAILSPTTKILLLNIIIGAITILSFYIGYL